MEQYPPTEVADEREELLQSIVLDSRTRRKPSTIFTVVNIIHDVGLLYRMLAGRPPPKISRLSYATMSCENIWRNALWCI
jgi:hypothetical protein